MSSYQQPAKRGAALRWATEHGRKLLEGNVHMDKEAFRIALWAIFPAHLLPGWDLLNKLWFDDLTQRVFKRLHWNVEEGRLGDTITDETSKSFLEFIEDPGLRLAVAVKQAEAALLERVQFYLEQKGLQDQYDADEIVEELLQRAS